MKRRVTTGFRGKLFTMIVLNGRYKLQEEVVKAESLCEFKENLDKTRLSAFGKDRVWVTRLRRTTEAVASHYFSHFLKMMGMRVVVTRKGPKSITGNKKGSHPFVAET